MRSLLLVLLVLASQSCFASALFHGVNFQTTDSILVVDSSGQELFAWQADKALVPASLVKLATANLAINKWGLTHRFKTDFFIQGETLWVKGYGDPFLVSEEIDMIALHLLSLALKPIKQINIDSTHFDAVRVPGRSRVADPYNAPISAVSANFNTAKLSKLNGKLISAEAQTPLTKTATSLVTTLSKKSERINLVNRDNAQRHFAEILAIKLKLSSPNIVINARVPTDASLLYRHENSHTVADVLRGTLEFSNNFMANQVFLKLAEEQVTGAGSLNFLKAAEYANNQLGRQFDWNTHTLVEGSGISRKNRLSARQIDGLLQSLAPNKTLFKKVNAVAKSGAQVYAKTGTLNGVRSYAGYIEINDESYRFVFNFNRSVVYQYREKMLERLLRDLIP